MKEPQQDWSPNDHRSPYYVQHLILNEEWMVIARGYPFSLRAFIKPFKEAAWSEQARTTTVEDAQKSMQALATTQHRNWWLVWVVMHCEQRDDDVREKPVAWYPSEKAVLDTLRQEGLLP